MTKQPLIHLHNVTKNYILHHEKPTLVENLFNFNNKENFLALNKLNLEIFQGEKIAIIGKNGAGKTTLLKIIAGITAPTSGRVKLKGRLVSLIDLEAGFHPELTGEENLFLNGLLIGMTKAELKAKYQQIVDFADLGKFIDAPLYTYSQGMKLRLGFSVAVHSDPDVLLLDETISVGDKDFRKKSAVKIEEFFKANKTIIMVSHWLEFLEGNCQRFIWIEGGKVKMDGGKEVVRKYREN